MCTLGYSMLSPGSPARCFGPTPLVEGRRFQLPRTPRTNRSRSASCGGGPCARSSLHRDRSRKRSQAAKELTIHRKTSCERGWLRSYGCHCGCREGKRTSKNRIQQEHLLRYEQPIQLQLHAMSHPCPSSFSPAKTSLLDTATGVLQSVLSSVSGFLKGRLGPVLEV